MPTVTKSQNLKIAFLLDEHSLKRIDSVLKQEVSEEIKYALSCSDGSSFEFSSVEDVLNIPNTKERQINSISINIPWHQEPQVRMKFRAEGYTSPIEYEITGGEKDVFYLSDKLDECISSLRQWYSTIAFIDFLWFFWVFFLLQ
jgi:hypothetical protein